MSTIFNNYTFSGAGWLKRNKSKPVNISSADQSDHQENGVIIRTESDERFIIKWQIIIKSDRFIYISQIIFLFHAFHW